MRTKIPKKLDEIIGGDPYRFLVQQLPETAVIMFDHELRFFLTDGPSLSQHGYDPDMMLGKTLDEALPAAAVKKLKPSYLEALLGHEIAFLHEWNGAQFDTKMGPVKDQKGQIIGGFIAIREVTRERRIARQVEELGSDLEAAQINLQKEKAKLKESTEILTTFFDHTNEGVIVVNMHGEFVQFNSIAQKILGLGKTSLLPKEWQKHYGIFASDGVTPIKEEDFPLTKALKGQVCRDIRFHIKNPNRPDGVLISASSSPILDEKKNIIGGMVIFRDITQEVKKEQELDDNRKQLFHASKLASIGELAAGVGHEINNPLSIILGYANTIERELDKQEPSKQLLKLSLHKHKQAVKRIANIVAGLRTFARVDSEDNQVVDLSILVPQTLELFKEIYRREGIQLILHHSHEPIPVFANFGRLQQVIINLLSNARHALKGKEQKIIEVSLKTEDSQAVLTIEDSGSGIPDDIKDKIFDTFFTTKASGEGTGLGLSLVLSIIRDFSGDIRLKKSDESGTTFAVRLPLKLDFEASKVHTHPKKTLRSYPLKVLVIDDEPSVLEVLTHELEHLGCEVTAFKDASLALREVTEKPFDCVFVDLNMPVMDGLQFIEHFNLIPFEQKIKIFAMTGGIHTDVSLISGIDGYLLKPFDTEEIEESLSLVWEQKNVA